MTLLRRLWLLIPTTPLPGMPPVTMGDLWCKILEDRL